MTGETEARVNIDNLLGKSGWHVCDVKDANITAHAGLAVREFPLNPVPSPLRGDACMDAGGRATQGAKAEGKGGGVQFADYLLYINGKAAGVIEAKKAGSTLIGVETQSDKYTKGLPEGLPAWHNPLPFAFESTGIETRFTNGLDPNPRSRPVFAFHTPEHLAELLTDATLYLLVCMILIFPRSARDGYYGLRKYSVPQPEQSRGYTKGARILEEMKSNGGYC